MAVSVEGFRVERDALGEKQVPRAALYGIHTLRAVESLGFSGRPLHAYPELVKALAAVKWAAATANGEAAIIPQPMMAALQGAAQRLRNDELHEHLIADVLAGGGLIAVHMNINEVLANVANEHLGGRRGDYAPVHPKQHVGASQSTADVCHTAARIAIVEQTRLLLSALDQLEANLVAQAKALATVPTLARTCLQDAMPTTLAVLFEGYAATLGRRRRGLASTQDRLRTVTLGGTVIGKGDGAPQAYRQKVVVHLARICCLDLVARRDLPSSMQSSDDLRAVSAQLAQLAESLLKICQDLRLLASGPRGGFGEILLPHVLEGSSFFGDKRNPVIPETVMQCCFQVLGCDRSVQAACEHAELYLNVFDGLAAINVLDEIRMLTPTLHHLAQACVAGLAANQERCTELAAFGHGSRGA